YIAMKVNEPEKVQIFGFVVIFPLSFMSTAFIPSTDGIPSGLAFAMDNSPVTHLVEAMRGLLVGGPVLNHALIALLWGVAISLVFAPLSLRAFKKRASFDCSALGVRRWSAFLQRAMRAIAVLLAVPLASGARAPSFGGLCARSLHRSDSPRGLAARSGSRFARTCLRTRSQALGSVRGCGRG